MVVIMLDDFFIRALFAGIGVALIAGPLGCIIVWRRLAFFGDTLAHGGLAGVALGLIAGINITLTVLLLCILLALALYGLQGQTKFASDTLLGVLSHAVFAIGLIVVALMTVQLDLESLLFGDILAVGQSDLAIIYGGGAVVLLVLWKIWTPLFAMTVNRDLAEAEGSNVSRVSLISVLLLAGVVALSLKIMGALLVSAMLVIPAATARTFTRTPEAMACGAVIIGILAVIGGLFGSLQWDLPTGPSVVACASLLFVLGLLCCRK